ncbi:hypothetical protein SAMN05216553_101667 [Lentzea fradiae]|uniref:Uncharacterized protein n=1 Tax=Lentzea fradiae TaxID=200378 RepID=A0A1G7L4C1_9PSEU|nr:hypothetical protein [Lentzea fradiae]SDF44357.1 hypothetical protein SAMN05216553_101667 [Lentzea fradiae]
MTPQETSAESPAHAVLRRSLFTEDAVIEFPYAPPGRPSRLDRNPARTTAATGLAGQEDAR